MPSGPLTAAFAYILWGVFPLYIKQIQQVPALEIVLHRSAWSLVFMLGLLALLRRFAWLGPALRQPRTLALFGLSALLLGCNWLLYVWAVNAGRVLDASLGYFINPLVNVLLGVLVLRERLKPIQWLAVALAAAGVLWLTLHAGRLPWIALVLASYDLGKISKQQVMQAVESISKAISAHFQGAEEMLQFARLHEVFDVGSAEFESAFKELWHEMLMTDTSWASTQPKV